MAPLRQLLLHLCFLFGFFPGLPLADSLHEEQLAIALRVHLCLDEGLVPLARASDQVVRYSLDVVILRLQGVAFALSDHC